MLVAISALAALGLFLGLILGLASKYLKVDGDVKTAEIEAMLPGSQCGQCGYPGCGPYAEAVGGGNASVSLCQPGGKSLALALAIKLGVRVDLNAMEEQVPQLAFVNEGLCIGCTKCFKRCPTDALVGANRQIHVVIRDACTGCGKCVEICPTQSLQLRDVPVTLENWYWPKPSPDLALAS